MRLPDQQFNQENRIHGRKLCLRVFTYHKLKWNNDLEVFWILSVLAHLIFRLHGLRDSQLWGKKKHVFSIFKVD